MNLCQFPIFLVILLVTIVAVCYGSVCPSNIVTEVFKCLYNLTMLGGSHFLVAGADISHVKQKCTDDSFRSTTNCIRSLLRRCSGRRRNVVKKLVDLRAMEKAFTQFCHRVDEYEDASGCIRSYDFKINPCIKDQMNVFDRKHVGRRTVEETVVLVCGFLRSMTVCIDEPVRNYCSARSANLLLHIMVGFTPPACAYSNYRYFTSGATSTRYLGWSGTITLTVLALMLFDVTVGRALFL